MPLDGKVTGAELIGKLGGALMFPAMSRSWMACRKDSTDGP
jgi:hypothetical protein